MSKEKDFEKEGNEVAEPKNKDFEVDPTVLNSEYEFGGGGGSNG